MLAKALLLLLALASGVPLAFYLSGNGPSRSALALATLPALALTLLLASRQRNYPRLDQALAAFALALLCVDVFHILWRLDSTAPGKAALRWCERRDCKADPPFLARLAPEDETVRAGMALSSALGLIHGPEQSALAKLLQVEYQEVAANPRFAALPSAPLLGLLRSDVGYQLWEPARRPDQVPCIVFLHGFGGQLSVYLKALLDGGLGESFAIVAPPGGAVGDWWSSTEQERLMQLLDEGLPAWIDPERIYLVGLSNGAVGATAIATSPSFAGRFRRVVAISGAGRLPPKIPPRVPPILFLTGTQDPRMPLADVEAAQRRLAQQGVEARLTALTSDHFLLLSHKHEVGRILKDWLRLAERLEAGGQSLRPPACCLQPQRVPQPLARTWASCQSSSARIALKPSPAYSMALRA
jgi:predicted esterase